MVAGRIVWVLIGLVALLIGLVGVVLPIVPTTPLVILAAFSFANGSPALARRLESSTTFGPIIADWRQNRAIAPRYKAIALAMMAAALLLGIVMAMPLTVLAVQLICILAASTFILTRPDGPAG